MTDESQAGHSAENTRTTGSRTPSVLKQGTAATVLTVVMTGAFHAVYIDVAMTPQIVTVFATVSSAIVVVGFWIAKRMTRPGSSS